MGTHAAACMAGADDSEVFNFSFELVGLVVLTFVFEAVVPSWSVVWLPLFADHARLCTGSGHSSMCAQNTMWHSYAQVHQALRTSHRAHADMSVMGCFCCCLRASAVHSRHTFPEQESCAARPVQWAEVAA